MHPAARALAACAVMALGCAGGPQAPPSGPSQTVEGLSMSRSDHGRPQWTLKAVRASLLDSGRSASLEAPAMELYEGTRRTTTVRSRAGLLDTKTHDLHLTGDVIVEAHEEKASLRTEVLDFDSVTRKFRTKEPVTLKRPGGVMRGRGLVASQDLSEVRISQQEARLD